VVSAYCKDTINYTEVQKRKEILWDLWYKLKMQVYICKCKITVYAVAEEI